MKKVLFSALIAIGFAGVASAQQKHDTALDGNKISVGAEFSLPNGDFGKVYPVGFGGSLSYIHAINQELKVTANAGYINYAAKEVEVQGLKFKSDDLGTIPLKAGLRYYLAQNIYAAGEVGATMYLVKDAKAAFTYAPGIGFDFPVSDKMTVDLSGRYEGWTRNSENVSFIGIRAALNFGL